MASWWWERTHNQHITFTVHLLIEKSNISLRNASECLIVSREKMKNELGNALIYLCEWYKGSSGEDVTNADNNFCTWRSRTSPALNDICFNILIISCQSLWCSSNTAQYDDDNNSVRMYMRGRPVTLYVPEKRADALNYDITKVQPAPSKKLKLDWVSCFHNR